MPTWWKTQAIEEILMRYTTSFLILAAPLLLSTAVAAQTVQPAQTVVSPQTSLQDAAVQLGHQYDSFYHQKSVGGMVSLYASDGELVSPGGKLISGREALGNYYRQRFASGASGHKIIVLETHEIGDTGYSISNFSVSVPTAGQPAKSHVEQGHIVAVYAHDTTGWHFALVQPSVTPANGS
jgi:ketosteroid isomerase-like protein